MRLASVGLAVTAVSLFALSASAQRGPGPGGPPGAGAEFFLARTGDLRLTDAQVIRLAAIARRTADRRRAMRASMDSLATRRPPRARGDTVDRATRLREADQMRARFDREREQARADLRDALAVLTPDQQALAWEMTSRGGPGAHAAGRRSFRGDRRERGDSRGPRDRRPGAEGQRPPQR